MVELFPRQLSIWISLAAQGEQVGFGPFFLGTRGHNLLG